MKERNLYSALCSLLKKEQADSIINRISKHEKIEIQDILSLLTPNKKLLAENILTINKELKLLSSTKKLLSSIELSKAFYPMFENKQTEMVALIIMNNQFNIIKRIKIADGGLTSCIFDIRIILSEVLKSKGTSFAIAHNHPSGFVHPSYIDDNITKKLSEASKICELKLIDHIIITNDENKYYSYSDNGKL